MNGPIYLQLRAHMGSDNRTVTLAGFRTDEFLNISVDGEGSTTHPDDAKALRNALLSIYPLDTPVAAESGKYTVNYEDGAWRIMREVPSTQMVYIGAADDRDNAVKIAKALNESEGL